MTILTGKSAERFVKQAEENFKNKGTIDFTKEAEAAREILKKAKLWTQE